VEFGGSSTTERNLWPGPYVAAEGARIRDRFENKLHALVCSGQLGLPTARAAIASNWWSAYQRYDSWTVTQPKPATRSITLVPPGSNRFLDAGHGGDGGPRRRPRTPRARCVCGNPLLPPLSVTTTPHYTDPPTARGAPDRRWPGRGRRCYASELGTLLPGLPCLGDLAAAGAADRWIRGVAADALLTGVHEVAPGGGTDGIC
jgi:hypothetical protein